MELCTRIAAYWNLFCAYEMYGTLKLHMVQLMNRLSVSKLTEKYFDIVQF